MRRVFTAALMIVFFTSTANATLDSLQEKASNCDGATARILDLLDRATATGD